MTDSTEQNNNPQNNNDGTRARKGKIPATLVNKDGSLLHLTKKQRGIIRRIPTADKFKDIADEMRCSQGTVSKTYKLPAVQELLRKEMEAVGITHGLLMTRIKEGIDATKEGKGSVVDKETGTIKADQVVDYGERREHVKLALRLQGLDTVSDDKGDTITSNTIYNIVIQARANRGLDK